MSFRNRIDNTFEEIIRLVTKVISGTGADSLFGFRVEATVTGSNTSGAPAAAPPSNAQLIMINNPAGTATVVPTAEAVADGAGSRTGIYVNARVQGYNGTAFDILRSVNGQQVVTWRNSTGTEMIVSSASDASSGSNSIGAGGMRFNNVTWDRERGNTDVVLLTSAARTVQTASADQVNYNGRGVKVIFDVTNVTGAPSLPLAIQDKDPASGKYINRLVGAAVTTATTVEYIIYPGATAGAAVLSEPLIRVWRILVTPGTADAETYSAGGCTIV